MIPMHLLRAPLWKPGRSDNCFESFCMTKKNWCFSPAVMYIYMRINNHLAEVADTIQQNPIQVEVTHVNYQGWGNIMFQANILNA